MKALLVVLALLVVGLGVAVQGCGSSSSKITIKGASQ